MKMPDKRLVQTVREMENLSGTGHDKHFFQCDKGINLFNVVTFA